jgi:hypothetical protein
MTDMLTIPQIQKLRRSPLVGRNKLGLAMKLAGVVQVEVAAGTGTGQSRISKIKRGAYWRGGLPVHEARQLARFFGCAIDDLFPVEKQASL